MSDEYKIEVIWILILGTMQKNLIFGVFLDGEILLGVIVDVDGQYHQSKHGKMLMSIIIDLLLLSRSWANMELITIFKEVFTNAEQN